MPHLITNKSARQAHPLYPNAKERHSMEAGKRADKEEKTTNVPRTYDAIKSAAGAEMKPKGKNLK